MKVKMTTCMAGNHHVWNVGDVVNVPDDEGARMVAAGFASEVKKADKTAVPADPGGDK